MVHVALFPSTSVFFRLHKYARGSAAATRKLKDPRLRGRTEGKGQPAIPRTAFPTPDCELPIWHTEMHPSGSTLTGCPQFFVADDVANRLVQVHAWGRRTVPSSLSIIHPAGCLKDTVLSHPSHSSLRTLKMKVLSYIAHCHPNFQTVRPFIVEAMCKY